MGKLKKKKLKHNIFLNEKKEIIGTNEEELIDIFDENNKISKKKEFHEKNVKDNKLN